LRRSFCITGEWDGRRAEILVMFQCIGWKYHHRVQKNTQYLFRGHEYAHGGSVDRHFNIVNASPVVTILSTIDDVLALFNQRKHVHGKRSPFPDTMPDIVKYLDESMHRDATQFLNYHLYSMSPISKFLFGRISYNLLLDGIEYMITRDRTIPLRTFIEHVFSKRRYDKKTYTSVPNDDVQIPEVVPLFFYSAATRRSYYVGYIE
jgi:hypothetical protein